MSRTVRRQLVPTLRSAIASVLLVGAVPGCSDPAAPPVALTASVDLEFGTTATPATVTEVRRSAAGGVAVRGPLALNSLPGARSAAARYDGQEVLLTLTVAGSTRYFGGPAGYTAAVGGVPTGARRLRVVLVLDGGPPEQIYAGALGGP